MRARVAVAAAAGALALAAPALAGPPRFASLPSPIAPLSPAPPLGGGASATSEGFRHRVTSAISVQVLVDRGGDPFSVEALQRLDVDVAGDYFFTIGAPLLDVQPGPGTATAPGLRSGAIIWAGFNPNRRVLSARATLDPKESAPTLPLRIDVAAGATTLVNATGVEVSAYRADAQRDALVQYLGQLRRDVHAGRVPTSGGVYLTSQPRQTTVRIVAPVRVQGTIGDQRVDRVVTTRLVVPSTGPVHLTVTPDAPAAVEYGALPRDGAQLLALATRASLTVARVRQYQTFLGNPDPAGRSASRFVYRTATRPSVAPPAAAAIGGGRSTAATLALVAGLLAAAVAGLAVWSRS